MSSINPYRTPSAALVDSAGDPPRHWAWRVYFGISAILVALGVSLPFIDPEGSGAETKDYVDACVYLVVLLGLFGFCFSRRLATQRLWKLFFPLLIAWDVYYQASDDELFHYEPGDLGPSIAAWTMMLLLIVPQYIALYRYAFRERTLWHREPEAQAPPGP